MSISIFGAPMKYGADVDGLEDSINSLVKYNKKLKDKIKVVEVKKDDKKSPRNLKHIGIISDYCNKLARIVNKEIEHSNFPLVIGGDHSVALGSVSGVSKKKNIGLFWIDAHGDFNTDKTTYSGHVHGMPLAAIAGLGDNRLANCYYSGPKVKNNNIILLGTRDFDDKEAELIQQNNILNISSRKVEKDGVIKDVQLALNHLDSNIDGIHISLDLDVIDPSICPGVSVAAPKGLKYDDVEKILKIIFATGKVISMDIVEYNPKNDIDCQTVDILNRTIELVERLAIKLE